MHVCMVGLPPDRGISPLPTHTVDSWQCASFLLWPGRDQTRLDTKGPPDLIRFGITLALDLIKPLQKQPAWASSTWKLAARVESLSSAGAACTIITKQISTLTAGTSAAHPRRRCDGCTGRRGRQGAHPRAYCVVQWSTHHFRDKFFL